MIGLIAKVAGYCSSGSAHANASAGPIAATVACATVATVATRTITDQSAFGLTYLENFVGLTNVFLTNKVAKGTMYATPAENLHLFGTDFSALAQAGLPYATDADGLIGIAHTPAYDRVSVETNVLTGCTIFPEVKDYIVKGTISIK